MELDESQRQTPCPKDASSPCPSTSFSSPESYLAEAEQEAPTTDTPAADPITPLSSSDGSDLMSTEIPQNIEGHNTSHPRAEPGPSSCRGNAGLNPDAPGSSSGPPASANGAEDDLYSGGSCGGNIPAAPSEESRGLLLPRLVSKFHEIIQRIRSGGLSGAEASSSHQGGKSGDSANRNADDGDKDDVVMNAQGPTLVGDEIGDTAIIVQGNVNGRGANREGGGATTANVVIVGHSTNGDDSGGHGDGAETEMDDAVFADDAQARQEDDDAGLERERPAREAFGEQEELEEEEERCGVANEDQEEEGEGEGEGEGEEEGIDIEEEVGERGGEERLEQGDDEDDEEEGEGYEEEEGGYEEEEGDYAEEEEEDGVAAGDEPMAAENEEHDELMAAASASFTDEDDEGAAASAGASVPMDPATPPYGCRHYRRRAKFVAPCCGGVFWCRHCHNDEMNANCVDPRKAHSLDRHAVTEVECGECGERQPKGPMCRACATPFAAYYCSICSFYDDEVSKDFFHCADCGICRVGGRANFFHCNVCDCCYPHSLRANHTCVPDALRNNCPVCLDFLFDSTHPASVLSCGHTIHARCFQRLCRFSAFHQCPVCKKSNLQTPEEVWRQYDTFIEKHPLPQEYQDMGDQTVLCNDCLAKSEVPFNLIAYKCGSCGGYNTDVV